ncbi:MAG: hypothetical protein JWO25_976 [Alphaproteobacteria bacterium]|nr:hypothetical protein [Alphaproteobacteria bacterium]MDB5720124.1 hypothetical protein [Alphaproteobacteria bacterium]
MTYEEAQQIAIDAGALEPQGMKERIAAGIQANNNWSFRWSDTPRAQGRLRAWTEAALNGVPAHELKRRIG